MTVISRTRDKEANALEPGADRLLVSSDEEAMAELQSGFDLIIDTVSVQHEVNPYVSLLAVDGALVMVGYFGPLPAADTTPLLFGRRTIMGTPVGGLAEKWRLSPEPGAASAARRPWRSPARVPAWWLPTFQNRATKKRST